METATVLRVRNWDTHYENNRTRDYKKLNWVPIPNRMDGDGYTELVDHPNGAAHLGAWVAIVQVASRCTPRGALMRESGQPHNAESLARITRLPVDVFAEATLRLLKIGWLEEIPQNTATIPQLPATIPQSKYAEQNRTEQNRTSNTCASGDARVTDSPTAEPKKHTKPNREMTPQRESWFTAWWDAYWLHKAKRPAREAFGRHVQTEARFQRVMSATREQTPEMLTREPQHRPHGATWLNGERWEDETASAAPRPQTEDTMAPETRRRLEERRAKNEPMRKTEYFDPTTITGPQPRKETAKDESEEAA